MRKPRKKVKVVPRWIREGRLWPPNIDSIVQRSLDRYEARLDAEWKRTHEGHNVP